MITPGSALPLDDGATVQVSCEPGYRLVEGSGTVVTCSDGVLSPIPTCSFGGGLFLGAE